MTSGRGLVSTCVTELIMSRRESTTLETQPCWISVSIRTLYAAAPSYDIMEVFGLRVRCGTNHVPEGVCDLRDAAMLD